MDLEILEVLFEEIETRVSMPSILVWSVEPFDGKAPALRHASLPHTIHPYDRTSWGVPPLWNDTEEHPHYDLIW